MDNMSANTAWYPTATAETLPPVMLETDPRMSCQHLEDPVPSIIANTSQCPVYRYSNTLAYKPVCRKRETRLMMTAGDITLPVVSKIGVVDDVSSQWYQKGAITKIGYPLDVKNILPAERLSIAQHMAALVARLHEKGIIHGDIKPENFVKRPKDECLRLANFSLARMADNSDLSTWIPDVPSVEYSSPNRQTEQPSTVTDDKFALAVSIWAVFAGEKPMVGLFNSNEGHKPDLTKITDDDMFCAVVDFLKEGGLKVDCPGTLARRDTLGIDRAVSFPLSLFDAELDDDDDLSAARKKPRFCPHCFEIAMTHVDKLNGVKPEPPVVYPEFCHLNTVTHVEEAVSDYALQWLQVQESAPGVETLDKSLLQPSAEPGLCTKPSGQRPTLQVNTTAGGNIEQPLGSATSSATVIAPKRASGRGRSSTVVVKTPFPALSESDEGYASMERGRGSSISSQSMPQGSSFQRTMSHWSESSVESGSEDDSEESEDDTDSEPGWSKLPQTPIPSRPMKLQATASFESVSLTDGGQESV